MASVTWPCASSPCTRASCSEPTNTAMDRCSVTAGTARRSCRSHSHNVPHVKYDSHRQDWETAQRLLKDWQHLARPAHDVPHRWMVGVHLEPGITLAVRVSHLGTPHLAQDCADTTRDHSLNAVMSRATQEPIHRSKACATAAIQ